MDLKPTEEQQAIIEAALSLQDSLLINALAGCAKTSTLEMICRALPVQPILSIAFNKRIAEEMAKKLPGHVKAQTINSLGHGVWAKYTNKKLVLDKDKIYNALKGLLDKMNRREKSKVYEQMPEVLKAVNLAKQQGYIPDELYPNANHLIPREEFFDAFDEEVDIELVDFLLNESIKSAYSGLIDFNDQIYMPTLFGGQFPQFPLVMVDESQDLSSLNHALLDKIVPRRLIAVGDPWQSIYAFRGADTRSMARLKDRFSMTELTLSVTFRCPIAMVENVRWRVPHFKWAPWAIQGEINDLSSSLEESEKVWLAQAIPDGAAIICRNNAPLLKCALTLLKFSRGVKLVGTDLGPGLIRTMKKLGSEDLSREEVFKAINRWEAETMAKRKNKEGVADKADCLRVFAEFGPTLGAAIAYAETLFSSAGPIQLMSGHKSKGLEFDYVYHLNPGLVPSRWAKEKGGEGLEQEYNLKYVIETRAKKVLYKVDLESLRP
jgi:superfamily I DNA/RNA helicase